MLGARQLKPATSCELARILYEADVAFVVAGKDHWDNLGNRFVACTPDIAVEVMSPSNTSADIERKIAEYLAAGSQRVWVAYPSSRTVAVHHPNGATITYSDDDVITDEVLLPGFFPAVDRHFLCKSRLPHRRIITCH